MPLLAIPGLGAEHSQLHEQGLYWLACDTTESAATLCRQVIAAMPEQGRAALLADARVMQEALEGLDPACGPAELALYEADTRAILQLEQDLPRIDLPGRVLVALVPAAAWEGGKVERWCQALRQAALAAGSLVVVISEGQSASLIERLRAFNQSLDGLAQLYRGQGSVRYLQHYWSNRLGVAGPLDVELARRSSGFAVAGRLQPLSDAGGDELLCLAQSQVLEGAPALSEHWQVFDSIGEVAAKANLAVSATVIFAMDGGQRLDVLARHLHTLRQLRGNALKLVVREMAPTLRYQDEQLLLACGASQIVPFGASLSRFLTMVDSIQGYVWRRHLPSDFDALLARLRPMPICGLVAPRAFSEAVQQMWHGHRNGEIVHQLLVLHPAPGLSPLQACSRTVFRRDGDIACVVGEVLFLFLFACRSEGVEQALDHIFQLSWKELFISQEVLVNIDSLGAAAFLDETPPQPPLAESMALPSALKRPALMPRQIDLRAGGAA
ncbi:cellulose biosynthesis protein BcsE [Pseudomonas plecoglossicida]|uniref:Cellulose biosynthesis protein BcsE n=1 Tax=Pseudomonas plecoglossicida TaxID=70775 RepID=A0AAD0R2A8_PSEDL|nr:cellulose biosynthesis protein BcsE [Pseudomonas plecoglossicida]AXM99063.1 cellulose biosynthesis protein BcsE [Pseudomonas plecoglossicida]QLB57915.1 cellulose biosynthesis protein BcsE [Pseudomonas plecoglossicida]